MAPCLEALPSARQRNAGMWSAFRKSAKPKSCLQVASKHQAAKVLSADYGLSPVPCLPRSAPPRYPAPRTRVMSLCSRRAAAPVVASTRFRSSTMVT